MYNVTIHVFSYITDVFILIFYAAILFRFQGDLDTYSPYTPSFALIHLSVIIYFPWHIKLTLTISFIYICFDNFLIQSEFAKNFRVLIITHRYLLQMLIMITATSN